jgi:glutamate/tyrosine decarboxylase-like PLP-dependent enzyme
MPGTTDSVLDPYTSSVQWSRRFIGLKLFCSLAHHGESGYVDMIEHQARMGDVLRETLTHAGWRIVNTTPLPVVCFTRDGLVTSSFLKDLYGSQTAWMSEVRLNGAAPVLRACITSFRTTPADIECVVREMSALVAR